MIYIFLICVTLLVYPMLGALFGAFAGVMVSLLFDETIRGVLNGMTGLPLDTPVWKVGATLGFVGGFFRSTTSTQS